MYDIRVIRGNKKCIIQLYKRIYMFLEKIYGDY